MKQKTRFKICRNISYRPMTGRYISIGPKKAISVDLYCVVFKMYNIIIKFTSRISKSYLRLRTPALGDSISLNFLLGTRLKSKSFHTLDDLMGFQVQKL